MMLFRRGSGPRSETMTGNAPFMIPLPYSLARSGAWAHYEWSLSGTWISSAYSSWSSRGPLAGPSIDLLRLL